MKFTQIPADTFKKLQLNAGIIVDEFTPSTGVIGNIIGATTGGNTAEFIPSFEDFGADIDNCPKDTKELKKVSSWSAKLSGSMVTLSAESVATFLAAADVDGSDTTKVVPRDHLEDSDFKSVWWIGDYGDKNGENGGFVACHFMNALSTGGFKIKSGDKTKGSMDYEFTAHSSVADTKPPFEIFVKEGTD